MSSPPTLSLLVRGSTLQRPAFNFVLDYPCGLRWAGTRFLVLDEYHKTEPGRSLTSEASADMLKSLLYVISSAVPRTCLRRPPRRPPPRVRSPRLLPIEDGEPLFDRWLFALRDNSTSWGLRFPLTPEHIEALTRNEE